MSATATLVPAGTWAIDPSHSVVGFSVKHLGIATVRGTFGAFAGTFEVGDDIAAGSISATIEAASIDTAEPQRDAHLQSPDFFDAAQFPQITFRSTAIAALGGDRLRVDGELKMHGVTRPVSLDGEVLGTETDPWGNERVAFELTGKLSRGEFGMTFNQALGSGNLLVSDAVKISLDISAVRQAA